jgi:SAM-dependent methyltransferase
MASTRASLTKDIGALEEALAKQKAATTANFDEASKALAKADKAQTAALTSQLASTRELLVAQIGTLEEALAVEKMATAAGFDAASKALAKAEQAQSAALTTQLATTREALSAQISALEHALATEKSANATSFEAAAKALAKSETAQGAALAAQVTTLATSLATQNAAIQTQLGDVRDTLSLQISALESVQAEEKSATAAKFEVSARELAEANVAQSGALAAQANALMANLADQKASADRALAALQDLIATQNAATQSQFAAISDAYSTAIANTHDKLAQDMAANKTEAINALESARETNAATVKTIQSHIDSLAQTATKLEHELSATVTRLTQADQETSSALDKARSEIGEQISASQEKITLTDTKLVHVEAEFGEKTAALTASSLAAQAAIEGAKTQITSLETIVAQQDERHTNNLQLAARDLESKIAPIKLALDSSIADYLAKFKSLEAEHASAQGRHQSGIEALGAMATSHEANLKVLETRLGEAIARIDVSVQTSESLDGKSNLLSQALETLAASLATLRTQVEQSDARLTAVATTADALNATTEALTVQSDRLGQRLDHFVSDSDAKAASIATTFAEIKETLHQALARVGELENEAGKSEALSQVAGLLERSAALEIQVANINQTADSASSGLADLSQRMAVLSTMELNIKYLLDQSIIINNVVNSAEVQAVGFAATVAEVNSRLDYFLGQVGTMSLDIFKMRNALGIKLNETIEGYSVVDRLQNVTLYARAAAADLQVRAGLQAKPYQPKRTPAISVEEIWREFAKRAPLNIDLFKDAFDTGAASYVGFPSGSCSIAGAPLAHEFARFIAPYLVNSGATLDIGCGPQEKPIYLEIAHPDSLHGVDILAPYEPHSFPFVQTAGEFLPWEDESFDLLVSGGALDHYYLLDLGMEEAWRILKPGGHYVGNITLFDDAPPYDPYSAKMEAYDSEHLYHINMAWFEPFMRERGFELVELMVFHLPFIYGIMAFKKVEKPVKKLTKRAKAKAGSA